MNALLVSWLMAVGLLGQNPLGRANIAFYDVRDCIEKGGLFVIHGNGFGNARGPNRIVLWSGGVAIEMIPTLWTDIEIRATVPTDDRVVEGRMYQVGIQDPLEHWLSNLGQALTICAKPTAPVSAKQLADAVLLASGGQNWPKVKLMEFTFNVAEKTNLVLSAKHRWDVRTGRDTVAWKDKNVTIGISNPGADPDSKAAYARWVNDSFWLLAPLKLRDAGAKLSYGGVQDGFEILQVSFAGVGDQYNLYVDPATHLVRRWDYMPRAGQKTTGTWENYKNFGGLTLATEHQSGGKRIWFSDVRVTIE